MKKKRLFYCLLSQGIAHIFEPALGANFTDQLISGNVTQPEIVINAKSNTNTTEDGILPPIEHENTTLHNDVKSSTLINKINLESTQTAPKSDVLTQETAEKSAAADANINDGADLFKLPISKPETKTIASTPTQDIPYLTLAATLSLIALIGFFAVKLKKDGVLSLKGNTKKLEIVETLTLGPKRHIFLIQVQGQQLLLGSTESSLQMLKDFSIDQDSTKSDFPKLDMGTKRSNSEQITAQPVFQNSTQTSKQALLANALGSLRKKAVTASNLVTQASFQSEGVKRENQSIASVQNKSAISTQEKSQNSGQQNGNFPKYLANAFAQESRRIPAKESEDEINQYESSSFQNSATNSKDDQQLDNVTNMIRAKLREMKPLS